MAKQEFGGDWTEDKLERIRKYLPAYTTILRKNIRAQYFSTIYVDAFAGTGSREEAPSRDPNDWLFGVPETTDVEQLKKGSARISLEVDPPFDRYLFIERDPHRAGDLARLRAEFLNRRPNIDIVQGEANSVLQKWCVSTDWNTNRAVVFLDPYGMQVDWPTIKAIADTKAIDMWWLCPIGVAVNRLLTREGPPPEKWAKPLTRMFGTDAWSKEFYASDDQPLLFDVEPRERKAANWTKIESFVLRRLCSVFHAVAQNPLWLKNSTGNPMYLLCFAAGNPKGSKPALKIARHILGSRRNSGK